MICHISLPSIGPVLIDFPIDVLFRPVEQSQISWGSIMAPLPSSPGPSRDAVTQAVSLWKDAKRPVIVVGTGSRAPNVGFPLLPQCIYLLTERIDNKRAFETGGGHSDTSLPKRERLWHIPS